MSRWFRLDDDVINDPKVLLLPEAMRWIWIAFLCIASKNAGRLPSINIIALHLRVKVHKAAEYLTRLVTAGLVDRDEEGFAPHNWKGRQFQSDVSTDRVKRFRERHGNVPSTVSETPPEIDTQTDTEPEQRKKTRAGALAEPWSEADWDQFWERFPNKVAKADARKAFEKASKKIAPEILFPALQRYAAKTDDRPFCNPSTWLNQERWLDQPAVNSNGRRTVQQAADDLLAKLREFDEPAPDEIRDGAGQDAVRLLPPH